MKRLLPVLLACAAFASLALTGCSSEGDSAAETELVEDVELGVLAVDNSFKAEVVTVEAGTEVVWENRGRNDHNIIPVSEGDFGVEIEQFTPGDVYSYRFTEPGSYPYYCSLHGNEEVGMIGTIEVTAS